MDAVGSLISDLFQPGCFFVVPSLSLEWEHLPAEDVPWEVFRGRLLDRNHCRQRRSFESWNVHARSGDTRSSEPLLSVKLDAEARQVHVTRAVYCYAWEGYDAGGNVYLSRETQKWLRELVATIELDRFPDLRELDAELRVQLFQAVVGVSRLPLTSVEAPLPQFSLGQLGYIGRSATDAPLESAQALVRDGLRRDLTWLETVKLVELVLRSVPREGLGLISSELTARWGQLGYGRAEFVALLRSLFDEAALSPYTDFVPTAIALLELLREASWLSSEDCIDFLSYLLRHLARHLTAYDLITFHHQGANYPDALLLDAVLKAYLALIDREPGLFLGGGMEQSRPRIRRRALRQAWLLRRFYEGLLVPDAPTSPGENARVLPPPHARVPEEQILLPHRREKRLFAGDPLSARATERAAAVLHEAIEDLACPQELQELGTALFLDRPLGVGKSTTEPDATLLLSYEAFSRSVAERRLKYLIEALALVPNDSRSERLRKSLRELTVSGVPLPPVGSPPRPGAVSIHDARKVADDFLLLRTTRRAARDFLDQFDFAPLAARFGLDFLTSDRRLLIVRSPRERSLEVFDDALRRRIELEVDVRDGYASRRGAEYPVAGLLVTRIWPEDERQECRLDGVRVRVRRSP